MDYDLRILAPIYLAFVAKHLFCDYFLQTGTMASCKGAERGWVRPLLAHAGVHAAGTLLVALLFAPAAWWLAPVDFAVHALVDRTKGVVTLRLQPSVPRYWQLFGIDQSAHQVTHFVFVLIMAAP